MQLKWPAAFSILNPRSSQAVNLRSNNNKQSGIPLRKDLWGLSGPTHRLAIVRNANRHDTSFNSTCTAPLSTSAYIIQTGLDKIWRNFQLPKHKSSHNLHHSSESQLEILPSSLQQSAIDKRPEQGVVHCSKLVEACNPLVIKPKADPLTQTHCHSPASSACSPSLRVTPTERQPEELIVHHLKWVRIFNRLPQRRISPLLSLKTSQPHASPNEVISGKDTTFFSSTPFLEAGHRNATPSEGQINHTDVSRELFYDHPFTMSHHTTSISDVHDFNFVPTSAPQTVETDFDRILDSLRLQSTEFTLTMQPTRTASPFLAMQNIPTPPPTHIIIYAPKPIRAFNPVPQLVAALDSIPSPSLDNLHRFPSGQYTVSHSLGNSVSVSLFASSGIAQDHFFDQHFPPLSVVPGPKPAKQKFSFRPFSPEEDTYLRTTELSWVAYHSLCGPDLQVPR